MTNTNIEILPNTEALTKETRTRTEHQFHDEHGNPVHISKIIYKNKPLILVYPYTYTPEKGIVPKKIREIEFRGWNTFDALPNEIKPTSKISLSHKGIAPLIRKLRARYPDFHKLIITDKGTSRFNKKTITLAYKDMVHVCKAIRKENSIYETRRKISTQNALASVTTAFDVETSPLQKGAISRFLSLYNTDIKLSRDDVDSTLNLITHIPLGDVTVTENFIQTSNKINIAYLDDVIKEFEALLDVKGDNEKDWQIFFEAHWWILASVFSYQVVLYKREAFVGGKTIENSEGRVVDFLVQNGFKDNYALLELKTHNTELMKSTPYRKPDAYALHEKCSGAISQCLDQKNIFLTDMGQKYSILDPKVVLIIGTKDRLDKNQVKAFELMRSNQKNVDIVTFDELLDKMLGLRNLLQR